MLCLACYGDRLASVLENATEFLLFERNDGQIRPAGHVSLPSKDPTDRTSAIVACGVTHLVCGAICQATLARLQNSGVVVEAWLRGTVELVLEALARDDLESLVMPGCAGRGGPDPCLGRSGKGNGRGGQGRGPGSGKGPGKGLGKGTGRGRKRAGQKD